MTNASIRAKLFAALNQVFARFRHLGHALELAIVERVNLGNRWQNFLLIARWDDCTATLRYPLRSRQYTGSHAPQSAAHPAHISVVRLRAPNRRRLAYRYGSCAGADRSGFPLISWDRPARRQVVYAEPAGARQYGLTHADCAIPCHGSICGYSDGAFPEVACCQVNRRL